MCGTIFLFPYFGLQSFSIWVFIPSVFMYFFAKERYAINSNYLLLIFFLFTIYGTFISFLGINIELSLLDQRKILLSLIFAYSIYYYCRLSTQKIHNVFIIFSLINYLLFYFVMTNDISFNVFDSDTRLLISDSKLLITTNTYGHYLYMSSASAIVLYNYFERNYLSQIHLMLNFLISYYLCFITASRGSFMIVSVLFGIFLFYLFFEKLRSSSVLKKVYFSIFSFIIVVGSILIFINYYQKTLLFDRLSLSLITDNRADLLDEFLSLDYDKYIFGIGSGNSYLISRYSQFTHNGFLEPLVSYGVIGFTLYLLFFKELISNFNKIYDNFSKAIFISIMLSYTAFHFIYAPYLTHYFLGFILTVYLWKEDMRVS